MILFVIIILLFHSYSCIGMQQNIPIKTSTGLAILPKWQIIESNTLYKSFLKEQDNQNNPLNTITLLSVSSDEISLFSQALEKLNNFNDFLKKLPSTKRQQLITVAGKYSEEGKKLNAKGLTVYLLHSYFNQDFLEDNIYSHIPIDNIHVDLKHRTIISNIQNKAITHTIIPCDTYKRTSPDNGDYTLAPLISENKNQQKIFLSFYTGDDSNKILKKKDKTNNDIKDYFIEYRKKRDKISYFITNNIPQNNSSSTKNSFVSYEKHLWLKSNGAIQICKTIKHPKYKIHECCFSNDGHYLAALSLNPDWLNNIALQNNAYITLTTLGIKEDGSDFSDTVITGLSITALCFNSESTILATATTNGIYLYKTNDGTLITHLCDTNFPFIKNILFNHSGNGLFALSSTSPTTFPYNNKLILWDINTFLSKEIILDDVLMGHMALYPHHNILSVFTTFGKSLVQIFNKNIIPCLLYFIDSEIGNVIYKIKSQEAKENLSSPIITVSPNGLLCAKASSSINESDIKLYDFYKQTPPMKLLSNQSPDIIGVGFTHNEQSLITALKNKKYINTMLYNDTTLHILEWIKNKTNILQRFFLYRLHKTRKNNQDISFHPQSVAYAIVESLPTEPYNVKQFIKNMYNI